MTKNRAVQCECCDDFRRRSPNTDMTAEEIYEFIEEMFS